MASKGLIVLGVLLATVLLVASEAALQHQDKVNDAGVVDQKYGGYPGGGGPGGGYPGGGGQYGGYPGGGGHGGGYPGGGGHGGGGPGGGYPGGGGHGGGYPGGGGHGGGGHGGGGRCYYGCCRRGYNGGCRCCSNANDVPDAEYLPEPHY